MGGDDVRIETTLEQVAAEAQGGLSAKAVHLGTEAPPADVPPGTGEDAGGSATAEFVVRTTHGLHARPAALLVRAASSFDADVNVTNLDTGRGPVSARSLNAVATLGVTKGQRVEASASGPQAREAIAALRELADRNFDERDEEERPELTPVGRRGVSAAVAGRTLTGLPASPGVAVGKVRLFRAPSLEVRDTTSRGALEDLRALNEALSAARRDIERQRSTAAGRAGAYRAAIFDAHLLLLDDEAIVGAAREGIASGESAAAAWHDAIEAGAAPGGGNARE